MFYWTKTSTEGLHFSQFDRDYPTALWRIFTLVINFSYFLIIVLWISGLTSINPRFVKAYRAVPVMNNYFLGELKLFALSFPSLLHDTVLLSVSLIFSSLFPFLFHFKHSTYYVVLWSAALELLPNTMCLWDQLHSF